jgi:hypothetical protein
LSQPVILSSFAACVAARPGPQSSFPSVAFDRAVGAEVIERLQPLSIEAVLAAADMQRVEFALEQSRLEAARARWQYDAVDPDNRS